jgi:hypothetical protein
MERQAGLGRSLEDVLDSLAPVEADPGAPGRVLFEPRDLERQVDQLAAEIGDVRERVQRLVGEVSEATVANGATNGTHQETADSERDSESAAAPAAESPAQPEPLEPEQHQDKKKKKAKQHDHAKHKKNKNKNKTKKKKKKKKKKNNKAKQQQAQEKSGNG